ncbi:MAG: hypothetical protein ACYC1G_14005, partial [Thiobacillus sp.]
MRRPSFQFYPADWQANSNLRRCTHEEKGVWMDVMCILHDQAEYGIVRWTLRELAQAAGCTVSRLNSLVGKQVLKGADAGKTCEPLIYVPRSGRKDGPPVTLIRQQAGPVWYSSRMVIDEHKRVLRGESGSSASGSPDPSPMPPFGDGSGAHPTHHHSRARPSSSSSSSSKTNAAESWGNATTPSAGETDMPPGGGALADQPQDSESVSTANLTQPMVRAGIRANPGHPDVIALAKAGCTPDAVRAAIDEASRVKGDAGSITQGYVLAILKRWQSEPAGTLPAAQRRGASSKQAARDAYLESAAAAGRRLGLDDPGQAIECDIT